MSEDRVDALGALGAPGGGTLRVRFSSTLLAAMLFEGAETHVRTVEGLPARARLIDITVERDYRAGALFDLILVLHFDGGSGDLLPLFQSLPCSSGREP